MGIFLSFKSLALFSIFFFQKLNTTLFNFFTTEIADSNWTIYPLRSLFKSRLICQCQTNSTWRVFAKTLYNHSENTLYNTLVFKNINQFNQAISLFKKRTDFRQQVRHLYIKMMDYKSEFIVTIPAIFPRV